MLFKHIKPIAVIIFTAIFFDGCSQTPQKQIETKNDSKTTAKMENQLDTITLGAGCFWCVEAIFQDLKGVEKVTSGYSGGFVKNPAYKEVCNGTTGHAEVCQLIYDPKVITFPEILQVFWQTHDPTNLNQQGNDYGTQYRSAIFYHNDEQKKLAETYKDELNKSKAFDKPIVTEITAYTNFYPAENYHQDYFNLNGEEPYCRFVIQPKVDKLKKVFKDKLKQ
jgi:peptide-methionine (S)-S-oxide reductase